MSRRADITPFTRKSSEKWLKVHKLKPCFSQTSFVHQVCSLHVLHLLPVANLNKKGHGRDQVPRLSAALVRENDAIMIFQGKKPTWGEARSQLGQTAAAQDERLNKGWKLKGEMQGDSAIWVDRAGEIVNEVKADKDTLYTFVPQIILLLRAPASMRISMHTWKNPSFAPVMMR